MAYSVANFNCSLQIVQNKRLDLFQGGAASLLSQFHPNLQNQDHLPRLISCQVAQPTISILFHSAKIHARYYQPLSSDDNTSLVQPVSDRI